MKWKHWLPSINVKQLDYAYHVAKRLDEQPLTFNLYTRPSALKARK
ncbi:hypothetical protein P7M58_23040 [Vibrio parahaemolyticus]|nr:hypothetical protein [Vibrio parahaemolyticus]MDG2996841.1 hypothetical protein [Vibrio parahaemolyticus]